MMKIFYNEVLKTEACGELIPIVCSGVYHNKEVENVLNGIETLRAIYVIFGWWVWNAGIVELE